MSSTLTENINLFQPTGFQVTIDRKNYGNLQFFVQSISHPGASNSSVETPYKRIQGVPMPGNTMEFGELTLEVLLDEDMNSYIEMYNWLLRLVNTKQIAERDNQGTIPTYADIVINALTSHNNNNRKFTYVDCVPTSVGAISFEATNQSVEYITFPASFRFSYFVIE